MHTFSDTDILNFCFSSILPSLMFLLLSVWPKIDYVTPATIHHHPRAQYIHTCSRTYHTLVHTHTYTIRIQEMWCIQNFCSHTAYIHVLLFYENLACSAAHLSTLFFWLFLNFNTKTNFTFNNVINRVTHAFLFLFTSFFQMQNKSQIKSIIRVTQKFRPCTLLYTH